MTDSAVAAYLSNKIYDDFPDPAANDASLSIFHQKNRLRGRFLFVLC
jgi:hypothetical protein